MDKLLTRTLCEAGAAAGQLTDCGINPAEDAQDSTCQNAPPHSPHSGPVSPIRQEPVLLFGSWSRVRNYPRLRFDTKVLQRWFEWESFGCILANAEERGETADYYFLREGKGKGDEAPSDDWDMVSTSQQHFPYEVKTAQFSTNTSRESLIITSDIMDQSTHRHCARHILLP